jgi:UDP-glucose:(heptosyl)LPS alpha-1,3-glucosyltransferase
VKVALAFPGCHRRAGVERIVFECARYLAAREHTVEVFATEWEEDTTQAIHYHRVPSARRPYFLKPGTYFRASTKALRDYPYEVLNTHGCVCPVGGVHWVQSVHRAWLERSRLLRGRFSPAGLRQRLNPLHPILLKLEARHFRNRAYRKVIATTPQVRDDLMRLYGVPETDVEIVPNGFAPEEFSPQLREARRKDRRDYLGLKPHETAILFVANELERKGYPTILDALRRLRRPDLKLLILGRADAETARRMASRAGVEASVLFCGSSNDVAGYHAAADIFVLPTQYEAFCLAILEALGSGLPVITSRVPGAMNAIQPGVNGAIIDDPKDGEELACTLEPFLARPYRDEISSAAPNSVADYRWPSVLARYEALLKANCSG